MVSLPHILTKTTTREYRSSLNTNRTDELVYWPEAMQYVLRTCATDSMISESTEHSENIGQNLNEPKNAYASRIGDAAYRCENVYTDNDNIKIFTTRL